MRKFLATLFFCYCTTFIIGQSNLLFGEWEAHLPYQRGLAVTQSPSKIYYATDFSVMSIDKEDNSLEFISKVDGLSQVGISDLHYDPVTEYLIIVYTNDEIDIMTPEGVINVPDIKNNLGIIGNKMINHLHFDEEKTMYISTGFGMVSYDLESFEFGFTTQMGTICNSAVTDDNRILYAATEEGVYTLDLKRNYNFSDFGNWTFLGSDVGLPLIYNASDITYFADRIWLLSENKVYSMVNDTFRLQLEPASGEVFQFFAIENQRLLIGSRVESQNRSQVVFFDQDLNLMEGTTTCANYITDAVIESSGRVWYADEWRGFKYTDSEDSDCREISNRSIFSNSTSQLIVEDDVLYAASGGVSDAFNFDFNRDGFYVLKDNMWSNFNEKRLPVLRNEEILNIFSIAKHPNEEKLYLGSFYAGLLQLDLETEETQLYNNENSPVIGSPSVPFLEKVGGLRFDRNNTLWITAFDADEPLIALTDEGTFHAYDINSSSKVAQIEVDDRNYKWIQVTGSSGGILIYDDAGEPKNPSLHRQRFLNSSNTALPSNVVNCIAKDLDGNIWVGTGQGPINFGCDPFSINSEGQFTCIGGINIVTEDDIPARLLETEDVRTIAFDGANQKWFGTRNGIFVQSPSGDEKVARFTSENSPLFNDNIIDLAFDPTSGKMYISSDAGIQAYQTNTLGGGPKHKNNVYAYPNPIRPEYLGPVSIKGLARDATVKITDINGQLVHETTALGGLAMWDTRDYNGNEVASGVYLVFSSSEPIDFDSEPDTAVTKILIVR